jgi:hypothetical protein
LSTKNLLCRQLLKREYRCRNHMTQGVNEQIGVFSAVKAECHLLQVSRQMLHANLVPSSNDPTLQQGECGFDRISVNVAPYILARRVIHGFMFSAIFCKVKVIKLRLVGHDDIHGLIHVSCNDVIQLRLVKITGRNEMQSPATFPDADDSSLLFEFSFMTALFSSDVGLINFDSPGHFRGAGFDHRGSDAVAEIPRGLVTPSDDALNLIGAHSLARFAQQVGRNKPLRQRKMRVLKHGARNDGKLMLACIALIAVIFVQPRVSLMLAAWALNAVRPAQPFKNLSAAVISSEHLMQFNDCHRSTCGAR